MLGVTTTSGPGFVLKQEALGLAVMTELPLVVVDVQRGGPSTGMPTKTEQADLLLALYGRNSESPLPVLAPSTPGDCFHIVLEAFALAVKYMTPVVVLSDGYLANSAEPWRIPDVDALPRDDVRVPHRGRGLPALRARSGDAGAPLGRSRNARASSTASAASPRRTSPATSPTTRRTTSA